MIAVDVEDDQGGRFVISDTHIRNLTEFQEALDLGYDFYITSLEYTIAVSKLEDYIDSRSDVVDWPAKIEEFDINDCDYRTYDKLMLEHAAKFFGEQNDQAKIK